MAGIQGDILHTLSAVLGERQKGMLLDIGILARRENISEQGQRFRPFNIAGHDERQAGQVLVRFVQDDFSEKGECFRVRPFAEADQRGFSDLLVLRILEDAQECRSRFLTFCVLQAQDRHPRNLGIRVFER